MIKAPSHNAAEKKAHEKYGKETGNPIRTGFLSGISVEYTEV
jgi:hypothetical protein